MGAVSVVILILPLITSGYFINQDKTNIMSISPSIKLILHLIIQFGTCESTFCTSSEWMFISFSSSIILFYSLCSWFYFTEVKGGFSQSTTEKKEVRRLIFCE